MFSWSTHLDISCSPWKTPGGLTAARIADDNSKFVSCGSDKLIFQWDVTSGQVGEFNAQGLTHSDIFIFVHCSRCSSRLIADQSWNVLESPNQGLHSDMSYLYISDMCPCVKHGSRSVSGGSKVHRP